jgi:hypothetical protein
MLVLSAAKLLQAVALGKLLQSFESSAIENVASNSYLWAGLLVLSAGTVLLTNHQVYFFTWRKGYVAYISLWLDNLIRALAYLLTFFQDAIESGMFSCHIR